LTGSEQISRFRSQVIQEFLSGPRIALANARDVAP
jgi:hypothetical protein